MSLDFPRQSSMAPVAGVVEWPSEATKLRGKRLKSAAEEGGRIFRESQERGIQMVRRYFRVAFE